MEKACALDGSVVPTKTSTAAARFISLGSPQAAARLVETITVSVNRLAEFPWLGRPGRISGTRELVISGTPYIVPYRVREQVVEVLRVYHASRRWPEHF